MAECPVCLKVDSERSPIPVQVTDPSPDDADTVRVLCPRCGTFDVERTLIQKGFEEATGIRLSGLFAEREDLGQKVPALRMDNCQELAAGVATPGRPFGYFDSVLAHVASLCEYPGQPTGQRSLARLSARTFLPVTACRGVLKQLQDQRLLTIADPDVLRTNIQLTGDGWRRVDEIATSSTRRRDRAFVAMSFHEGMKETYSTVIYPTLVQTGYNPPFRVNDPEHDATVGSADYRPKIDDRILAEIRRARFVVAEVTGSRTSVYFEAGFAEGLGIPIIWCCHKDSEQEMAFDTRQNAHILWTSPDDLASQLVAKIRRHGWEVTRGT